MFTTKNNFYLAAMMLLSVLAFVGLIGCSEVPSGPEDQQTVNLLTRSFSAQKILGDSAYLETIISASEGGKFELHDVQLYFPPKALDNDTLISISIPDLSVFANDFGTDGLVFNVPVRVTMNYRDADLTGINESTIKMAWYNEHTDSWDIIDCELNLANKTVTADVNHFSAYALITDE
jgi:hypothetical protein